MENATINTDDFVNDLSEIDPKYTKELKGLENKYSCSISCFIEKHNALQYTYFYEVDFNRSELFYAEIESGINNGTQVNSAEWGHNTMENTKIVEILKDIKLDEDFYKDNSFLKRKAQAVLDANKSKLFDFHRKNNCDNYVTGGNSKLELDPLLKQLKLHYIFEEEEVFKNFI